MTQGLKIIFMGTPEFAVASLDALVKADLQIAAVVTAPDKPAGRGYKLHQSKIKEYAVNHHIPVLQPAKLKSPEFIEQLKNIKADLQIVVAFRMLPEIVWNMPPMGTINLHASLLPQYRGAAPINWAIINGEKITGVTTFKLQHEIDTGNILLQKKVPITETETAGTLHDKLMHTGADLLLETVSELKKGSLKEIHQNSISESLSIQHAPKIFTEDCEIDWKQSTENVYNRIRGLSPHPGAFTFLKDKRIKILESSKEESKNDTPSGSYATDKKTYLKFATKDGFIAVTKLKPEGKSEMTVEDFLRGKRDL